VVLKYLARYVHRVALSNSRLVSLTEEAVSFLRKDYAHGGKERVLTLVGDEFLRRWVQHVLPRGFVKARHDGPLASCHREEKLAACRQELLRHGLRVAAAAVVCCPECGGGPWVVVGELPRPCPGSRLAEDTS
jgi:hypothetical protein